ncbi:hypothetical protein DY000_02036023 [Brassica cretica]|uniref:Pectate lyase domain-containing protein n=1 Tax=Brassica cretica TaxID=69181 RepID=A0ABQ7E1H3_BRACR|nr:hypothetical protein DY000_02036023 [Brassica cretica]
MDIENLSTILEHQTAQEQSSSRVRLNESEIFITASKEPKISYVYSSDLKRVFETAQIIAAKCGTLEQSRASIGICKVLCIKKLPNFVQKLTKPSHLTAQTLIFHMLIGADPSHVDDRCIRVTVHHCFFDGTRQRQPRLRFGKVHLYNNYTRNWGIYAVCATVAIL